MFARSYKQGVRGHMEKEQGGGGGGGGVTGKRNNDEQGV